jgi:hypothetical protein
MSALVSVLIAASFSASSTSSSTTAAAPSSVASATACASLSASTSASSASLAWRCSRCRLSCCAYVSVANATSASSSSSPLYAYTCRLRNSSTAGGTLSSPALEKRRRVRGLSKVSTCHHAARALISEKQGELCRVWVRLWVSCARSLVE